jgi:hypothetical protein
MKKIRIKAYIALSMITLVGMMMQGCQKDDFESLQANPNVPGKDLIIPPSQLLNHSLYQIFRGGGILEVEPGSSSEEPFRDIGKWCQFLVSNDTYYGGNNTYNWSNSATHYSMLRNVIEMERWSNPSGDEKFKVNPYTAMGKFLRAYSFIWFTQRVGDIPMSEAGLGLEKLQPKYDSQQEVYKNCLILLDEANDMFSALLSKAPVPEMGGDFYHNGDLATWQKVVNTYTLRVLISLSKRADDTPDLQIKERFANIVGNPSKYPVMESNADNVMYRFNSGNNRHPKASLAGNYNASHNISKTYLDLMTKNSDPRTFVTTCPAPAEIIAGKAPDDFTAYVGSDNSITLPDLNVNSGNGMYSHSNHRRYYNQSVVYDNAEPYIIFGYGEMCFNIAEGINRGWATGDAGEWYLKGINASLAFYGIADGEEFDIEDLAGKHLGVTTFNLTPFYNAVAYKGNNSEGLEQILEQKFISFHQNSSWEPFYQWRRTGIPKFIDSGVGISPTGKIPRRWQYPPAEKNENSANYQAALDRQYSGEDDLYQDIWAVK